MLTFWAWARSQKALMPSSAGANGILGSGILSGALLGGYPLAQGTIHLLMNKRFADISAVVCSTVILVAAVCVFLSPIAIPEGFDQRLTGRVFEWQWVRAFSPLLNLYAFVFLFGGAVYSAIQYFGKETGRTGFLGNILIAIGALLPGIGGTATRFGHVEVLYVTELIELIFIYYGYHMMRKAHSASLHANQQSWEGSAVTSLIRARLAVLPRA